MLSYTVPPHVARAVQDTIQHPHTARTSRRVYSPHKRARKGRRFGSDEDVKAAEVQWFHHQPRELFAEWAPRLVHDISDCGFVAVQSGNLHPEISRGPGTQIPV
jgi:hypothetical protein